MVLNNYRHLLPRFTNGPVNFCIKHNITPNQVSLIGFFLSTIAAITYAFPNLFLYNYTIITPKFWWFWAGIPPLLFFIASYVDVRDGALARKTNQVSAFGGFLDSTLDRISDAVIVIGLVLGHMLWPWDATINMILGYIALTTMLLISYTRSRAELEGVVMKGIGFMERAERVFILLFGYLLEWSTFAIEEYFYGGFKTRWVFPVFFIIYTLLCIQTLYKRIMWTYKWLNDKIPEKKAEILRKMGSNKQEESLKENDKGVLSEDVSLEEEKS